MAGGHDFETSLQRLGYDANCAAAAFRDLDRQNAGGTNIHYLQSGGQQGKAVAYKNWDSPLMMVWQTCPLDEVPFDKVDRQVEVELPCTRGVG